MKQAIFCQSCSMPMDGEELWGTEKDGSKSTNYCKFCYQDGRFTHPDFTLQSMQAHMLDKLSDEKLPPDILEAAISRLPHLKRWKKAVAGAEAAAEKK